MRSQLEALIRAVVRGNYDGYKDSTERYGLILDCYIHAEEKTYLVVKGFTVEDYEIEPGKMGYKITIGGK